MIVNGREYPLWSQFIERKDEFIGKELIDNDMGVELKTIVTDIVLKANGEDSVFFSIEGEDFSCGFDVRYGGISPENKGIISFSGFQGQLITIK